MQDQALTLGANMHHTGVQILVLIFRIHRAITNQA